MNGSSVEKDKYYILKLSLIMAILILVLIVGYFIRLKRIDNETVTPNPVTVSIKSSLSPTIKTTTKPTPVILASTPVDLPDSFSIKNFPFQTQAPDGNWDALHEEACEEASIILVDYFLKGQTLSVDLMNQEIHKLVDWEAINYDGVVDVNVEMAGQMAQANYGLNYKVIKNSSITELKTQIAAGHPVIVPAAGRLLGNPNFRGIGPVYHMIVAIGYDQKNIIVQDIGTRNGNYYSYNQEIFDNAWHDWTGLPETVEQGAKNMLILSK
jgi:hypothetical protein